MGEGVFARALSAVGNTAREIGSAIANGMRRFMGTGISKGRALQRYGAEGEKAWEARQTLASGEMWLRQRTIYGSAGRRLIDAADNMGRILDRVKIRNTSGQWHVTEIYEISTRAELATNVKGLQILRGDRLITTPGSKIKGPGGKGWLDLPGTLKTIPAPWD
jgi:hypothetical protein